MTTTTAAAQIAGPLGPERGELLRKVMDGDDTVYLLRLARRVSELEKDR